VATLAFCQGCRLDDPEKLLIGIQKEVRHYRAEKPKSVQKEQVALWLRQSLTLNEWQPPFSNLRKPKN
jgi:hypothetical protein